MLIERSLELRQQALDVHVVDRGTAPSQQLAHVFEILGSACEQLGNDEILRRQNGDRAPTDLFDMQLFEEPLLQPRPREHEIDW